MACASVDLGVVLRSCHLDMRFDILHQASASRQHKVTMATRRAVLAKPALFTSRRNVLSVTSHLVHRHQGRGYAAPSRSEVFNLSQIPQASFESVISRNGNSFKHLSCAEYYVVAQKFTEAIRRGSSPWAVSFSPSASFASHSLVATLEFASHSLVTTLEFASHSLFRVLNS